MPNNFNSIYKHYANQELKWLTADTEERYHDNIKNRYDDLKRFGWLEKSITYKFNSYGFRCDEFSDRPTAMFLGCSNTVGVGIPYENTWAYIVSKELNLECANLGLGGGSSDSAFRMCLGYIDIVKPKLVVYNQPPAARLEIINDRNDGVIENFQLFNYEHRYFQPHGYIGDYISCKTNINMNKTKNLLAIKYLCHERNIKFLYFDNYGENFGPVADRDMARDLMHPGILHNAEFAEHVLTTLSMR